MDEKAFEAMILSIINGADDPRGVSLTEIAIQVYLRDKTEAERDIVRKLLKEDLIEINGIREIREAAYHMVQGNQIRFRDNRNFSKAPVSS